MIYLILAYEFFKIGLFSIGGGMATLPFLMDLTGKYEDKPAGIARDSRIQEAEEVEE